MPDRSPLLAYVAGPFSSADRSGVVVNIQRAEEVGLELAELGLFPVIPHTNTSHAKFEELQPYRFWILGTLELLKRCDMLVTVPGWEASSGARGEVAWAEGRTGSWFTRAVYSALRYLTGVGRIPVFHHPRSAAQWAAWERSYDSTTR